MAPAEAAADAAALVLLDGVIMLGAALAFVMAFRRLGLGAVLGYLVAGALIGPNGLGLINAPDEMLHIADLGIVLLLFLVGLELHPERLWRLKNDIFGLGLLQVTVTGLALTVLVHVATGFSWAASLAIGLPLALSSTAQVLPSLRADGSINTHAGERAFSILLFQDLSIVPLITIIAALSRAPADPSAPPGWQLTLYTLGAIVGLVLAGRFLINPLFRLVGRISERELFIVAGLFIVLASAAVMEALHLSTALGAFIAGVMLADSPYRHELEADIDPFRSILLGLFFLAVGMMLDLGAIAERPLFVIGMAAALITVKAVILFGLARLFRMETRPRGQARPAAEPGRRVRLRPVRRRQSGHAGRARGGEPVRRDRHHFDGDDAVPDDVQRLARPPLHPQRRRRARRSRALRQGGGDRRRLWPFRPDRRADDDGQGHPRHPDRFQAEPDRGRRAISA